MDILQPPGWAPAKGYANGTAAAGKLVFIAGQVGWDPATQRFEHADFAGQFGQTLRNILAVLEQAGGKAEHIVRMTWFLTDRDKYHASQPALGEVYRSILGRHYPAMAVVEVSSLLEDEALLEIETTAVIPTD